MPSASRTSGKARLLAVTTAKKASAFPDLPTMNTYFPGFESDNWYAMWFPAGTPRDIVTKMNGLIVNALKDEKVRGFMVKEGLDPVASTPEELGAQIKRWTRPSPPSPARWRPSRRRRPGWGRP